MRVRRGDVVQVDLSPVIGSEQAGLRPALVLQIDRANKSSPITIIAPFTSKIRKKLFSSHVRVPVGVGGLTLDSVLLCEQIRVIDCQRIVRTLGHLEQPQMDEVAEAIRGILGV